MFTYEKGRNLLPKQVLYQAELCPDTITQEVSALKQEVYAKPG